MQNRSGPADCPLSRMELKTVELVANGLHNKQVAERLGVSVSAVRTSLHMVYGRLGVDGATQAAVYCWRKGWISVGEVKVGAPPVAAARRESRPTVVTPAHRVYLYAFDLLVAARTDEEKRAARAIMHRAAEEAGIPTGRPGRPDTHPSLVDLLVRWVSNERRPSRTLGRREAA